MLKLEDLVTLIVDHVEWTAGREPYQMDDIPSSRESPKMFPATTCKHTLSDVQKEKQALGEMIELKAFLMVNCNKLIVYSFTQTLKNPLSQNLWITVHKNEVSLNILKFNFAKYIELF